MHLKRYLDKIRRTKGAAKEKYNDHLCFFPSLLRAWFIYHLDASFLTYLFNKTGWKIITTFGSNGILFIHLCWCVCVFMFYTHIILCSTHILLRSCRLYVWFFSRCVWESLCCVVLLQKNWSDGMQSGKIWFELYLN